MVAKQFLVFQSGPVLDKQDGQFLVVDQSQQLSPLQMRVQTPVYLVTLVKPHSLQEHDDSLPLDHRRSLLHYRQALLEDCDDICVDENLLGDGNCDSGDLGSANFNCQEFTFDNTDCPIGNLDFGNIIYDDGSGTLEIIMDCQFNVSNFVPCIELPNILDPSYISISSYKLVM